MGIKSNLFLWIVLIGMEGSSVIPLVLPNDVQEYNQIFWYFGPQKLIIARCGVNETPRCEITLGTDELKNTFRGRLKIHNNGSLTIMNISDEQAGPYTIQVINKWKKSKEMEFNVGDPAPAPKTVNDSDQTIQPSQPYSDSDSGLSPGYVALICVLVLGGAGVAVAAAVFFYKRRKARRKAECAYHFENGTVSSINSHPDERRSFRINEES